MDNELLKERQKFKESFMKVHTDGPKAEKRPAPGSSSSSSKKSKPEKEPKQSAKAKLDLAQLKQMGTGSQFKFGVLTKIVRHMKNRHMEGEDHPLTIEDALDETHQLDVDSKTKFWLSTEALRNNPKIDASGSGPSTTYLFKPPFNITTKKALMKLLKGYSIKGKGGILLEDLQESLPKCEAIIRKLEDNDDIWIIPRPQDKKKIVYFHDEGDDFDVSDEFVKLWRSVTVDGQDDVKIDEYLSKNGITSMEDQSRNGPIKRKPIKRNMKKRKVALKDNLHVSKDLDMSLGGELSTAAYKKS